MWSKSKFTILCMLTNFVLHVPFSAAITKATLVTDLVYLDIDIGGKEVGRIVIGLFGGTSPKTVRNFISLATEEVNNLLDRTYMHLCIVWLWVSWINFSQANPQFHDARYINATEKSLMHNHFFTM